MARRRASVQARRGRERAIGRAADDSRRCERPLGIDYAPFVAAAH